MSIALANIQQVFFDMDGVLLNSEPLHYEAKILLLKRYGVQVEEDLSGYVGVSNKIFWADMIRKYRLDADPETMAQAQAQLIVEMVRSHSLPMSDGLPELLGYLDSKGIGMMVVSSSPRTLVEPVLEFLNIRGRFHAIITGDDVERVKPAPDIYLLALKTNRVPVTNAIAVEDSKFGIQAALTANLSCVGYVNPTSGNQDLGRATYRVTNLFEIAGLLEGI